MRYLENPSITDPHINLAVEEYLLRHKVDDEPILLFYVNDPSIIIGRNQNVLEEINFDFVRRQGMPVLRRLSGGGTVYHDQGNLNFSLITPDQKLLNDYESFTSPLIRALQAFGLPAVLRNRNSIFVGEKKVSGNAQYATSGRLLSHGTLLLDSNLDGLREAITPPKQRVQSRAVQSIRSSVTNLSDLLGEDADLELIRDRIRMEFLESSVAASLRLDEADWQAIRDIAEERYRSWAWNFGRSPKFSTTRQIDTDNGDIVLEILVEKGHIQAIMPADNDPQLDQFLLCVCDCLEGLRYEREAIAAALQGCGMHPMPPGLDEKLLMALLF